MKTPDKIHGRFSFPVSFMLILLSGLSGCGEEKDSLHELDHVVPPHWPEGLQDAANKIGERITILNDPSAHSEAELASARQELSELINWAPEIAADTDLAEQDWIPIYERSEGLHNQLKPGAFETQKVQQQLVDFQALLREAEAKLPETVDG
jgi:hypothetical protein